MFARRDRGRKRVRTNADMSRGAGRRAQSRTVLRGPCSTAIVRCSSALESAEETLPATAERGDAFVLERGDLVARYVIIEKVGAGGMGAVYAAFDPDLDRRVAIKVLHATPGPSQGSSATQRLLREAQAMARLAHPNVIRVLDVGRHRGEVFVAMEFVDGVTLEEYLAREEPSTARILELYREAARGLTAAHDAGLVHRDFKPANVMIDRQGRVYVMDLGLARLPGRGAAPPIELLEDVDEETTVEDLTRTGALMGTPAYMSPEQYLGQEVDARSDQFSFFVALYEAVYGDRPFRGETPAALAFNVTQGERRNPPARSRVSGRVRQAILRGLEKDPARRFPDMRAAAAALSPRRSRTMPIAAGLIVVALGIGGWAWSNERANAVVCDGADDAVARVWNDERRASVREAFAATGLEFAAGEADRTIAAIDRRVVAWADQRRAACEATQVYREQSQEALDLRVGCLDERLAEVDALVGVLVEADADTVGNAARALSNLRPLESCSDVAGLRSTVRPPADAETAAQVESVRERLHRARMLDEAGRYAEGLALVLELEKEATAIDYAPLIAEVENIAGSLVAHTGDWAGSETHFERAYFTAMGGVHPDEAARAAVTLIKVTGSPFALGRREDGLAWSRHAEGAAKRLEDGGVMEAMRLANVGHVLALSQDNAEAIEKLQTATEILEARLGPDNMRVILGLNDLAYALARADRHDEAIAVLERVLEIEGGMVGDEHPLVASTRGTLGSTYISLGRFEDGERETLTALGILERTGGRDHPNVSSMLVNLADLYEQMGRTKEMIEPLERAVAIRAERMGPGHPIYVWTLTALASAYFDNERPEDALATTERALREAGDLPKDHRYMFMVRTWHARSLIALGRVSEGLAELEAERAALGSGEKDQEMIDAVDAWIEESRAQR